MAVDVYASCCKAIEHGEHAARLVVNFGEHRLTLNEGVGASLEHCARLDIIGGLQDDVADVADPAATDPLEVNPLALELAAECSERPRLMRKLDDELMCHGMRVARTAAVR